MKILNKLTIKDLKLNKKRTIVTIIGIILATALITAVSGMVMSLRESLIEYERMHSGNFHYKYLNVPKEDIKYFSNNRNLKSYYLMEEIGYSKLVESKNEEKPYLCIKALNKQGFKDSSIKLIEGRLPENSNEVVISSHIKTNARVKYNIGDKLSLEIGKRIVGDHELNQDTPYSGEGEEFVHKFNREYVIVGIIERPTNNIEYYFAPGYTVITYMDNINSIDKKVDVYTLYNTLKNKEKTTAEILGISEESYIKMRSVEAANIEQDDPLFLEYQKAKYTFTTNQGLIRYEGLNFSDSVMAMLFSVASVVIVIIIFTSVFCIRNSFAISITEKIRQYGMLSSIGATSKQINKNVYYEALILSLIGIPIGILTGIFATFILTKVVSILLVDALKMELIFTVSYTAIILSLLLSIATILLSARSSARKASKVSPIEAIRGSSETKINAKKIKSPGIIKKIFGIGGEISYKNFKRNRSKYRTTVLAIVVSVSIFIGMSSFINYAFKVSNIYYKTQSYNLKIISENMDVLSKISKLEGVDKFAINRLVNLKVKLTDLKFADNNRFNMEDLADNIYLDIRTLNDEEYRRYIKDLGLDYDFAKDKAILIDEAVTQVVSDDGKTRYENIRIYKYEKGDIIKGTLNNQDKEEELSLKIATHTSKRPMGLENLYNEAGMLVVNERFLNGYSDYLMQDTAMFIQSNDATILQDRIEKEFPDSDLTIYNSEEAARHMQSLYLIVAIFLYGFIIVISLIGITNIFNTITTNMKLRSKEFAMLKSVGMTKKEFNRMIRLESLFYGTKSLLIGIPIGIAFSLLIYQSFVKGADFGYILPIEGILISIIVVFILIAIIMKYSLSRINKQNIIETIRKDNI